MRYEQLIDRAEQLAFGVGNVKQSADASITAQTIFPHAVRHVLERLAKDGMVLHDTIQTHEIAIKFGVGDLPKGVLKNALEMAIFPGRQLVSYLPYQDFVRYKFLPQMDYYAINGECFYFAENGECGCTKKIKISIATVPAVPTNIDADLPLSANVAEEVILTIASVLRGEQSLAGLAN